MGMLRVFAGIAFLCGGLLIIAMITMEGFPVGKTWDNILYIICGGVVLLALDKIILTLEEIRDYLKKFSKTIGED